MVLADRFVWTLTMVEPAAGGAAVSNELVPAPESITTHLTTVVHEPGPLFHRHD